MFLLPLPILGLIIFSLFFLKTGIFKLLVFFKYFFKFSLSSHKKIVFLGDITSLFLISL